MPDLDQFKSFFSTYKEEFLPAYREMGEYIAYESKDIRSEVIKSFNTLADCFDNNLCRTDRDKEICIINAEHILIQTTILCYKNYSLGYYNDIIKPLWDDPLKVNDCVEPPVDVFYIKCRALADSLDEALKNEGVKGNAKELIEDFKEPKKVVHELISIIDPAKMKGLHQTQNHVSTLDSIRNNWFTNLASKHPVTTIFLTAIVTKFGESIYTGGYTWGSGVINFLFNNTK